MTTEPAATEPTATEPATADPKKLTEAAREAVLEPVLIIACGREAQVHMRNHGAVTGRPACVGSIELWRVNDDGLIDSVRAFWEPPAEIHAHLGLASWTGPTELAAVDQRD